MGSLAMDADDAGFDGGLRFPGLDGVRKTGLLAGCRCCREQSPERKDGYVSALDSHRREHCKYARYRGQCSRSLSRVYPRQATTWSLAPPIMNSPVKALCSRLANAAGVCLDMECLLFSRAALVAIARASLDWDWTRAVDWKLE